MTHANRQFVLAARPHGDVKVTDLRYVEVPVPEPAEGQVLIRTNHISLDPSMRGQMEGRSDYTAALPLGAVMRARAVGNVVASRNPTYPEGTQVFGFFGMQDYALSNGVDVPLQVYDPPIDPEVALGVLGGTGMTAYFGLLDIGRPRAGDTVVVSGAAGATGSVAGQIARLLGCRVIGIAGTAAKCAWLTDELGFHAAIDYRSEDVPARLDALCPNGIDVYFDNVGGAILDACLARLAMSARVVICGGISRYNATETPPGPRNYFNLVYRRARMEGFILTDYASRFDEARAALGHWHREGLVKQRATVIEGFERLPEALVRLFAGENTGKMLVRTSTP